jgi:hypothetical protein
MDDLVVRHPHAQDTLGAGCECLVHIGPPQHYYQVIVRNGL